MKQSIYFRNFIATALIVLFSFALLGGLFSAWMYRQSIRTSERSMEITLQETARYIITQHVYNDVALNDFDISMLLSMASEISGLDILLTNIDGVVYACSERDFKHLGKQISLYELQELAVNHQRMILASFDQIYEGHRQVMAVQLRANLNNEPEIIGYLILSTDIAEFTETWKIFTGMFFLIALGVMILTFASTFYSSKRQAAPINEMAGAARRFARGDFSIRVEDTGRVDEFGQLTLAFNAMADSLESSETFRRNFIANLSHELKTPMTVIAGFAEGLLDGTIPGENQEHYLGIVASETRRLSRLVESMLDITILESPDVDDGLDSSFDISEVARLALLSLSSKIEERGLDVETDLPEEAIITLGDKDSITQVIYNLLDNAIKFSNPKGVIGLRLWKQGGKAYVSVENSGRTIPPTELPHIFERFHKIDKSRGVDREGVGLGLYLVKTILDKHNQDIYVSSENGKTRFMFTLTIE